MPNRCWPLILAAAAFCAKAEEPAAVTPRARCDHAASKVLDAIDGADYSAAVAEFDDGLRARYPAAKLKTDVDALAKYGRKVALGGPHTGMVGGELVVLTPLMLEHATYTIEMHCGADGRMTDFRLEPTQIMSSPRARD